MTKLIDVLNDDPRIEQLLAERGLASWSPGEPVPERGRRLLIGFAPYSGLDLAMLDLLADAKRRSACPVDRIDVFNINKVARDALESYVPRIGKAFQTPIVGLWVDGELREKSWGAAARSLLGRVCGLEDALRRLVDDHYARLQNALQKTEPLSGRMEPARKSSRPSLLSRFDKWWRSVFAIRFYRMRGPQSGKRPAGRS